MESLAKVLFLLVLTYNSTEDPRQGPDPVIRSFAGDDDQGPKDHAWDIVTALLPGIIDRWQWRNLYLYVEGNFGITEAKMVYAALEGYQKVASVKLIKTTREMQPKSFLKMVHGIGSREVKAVVVICGPEIVKDVAEEASAKGMFSYLYRWLFMEDGSAEFLQALKLRVDTDVVLMRHHVMSATQTRPSDDSVGTLWNQSVPHLSFQLLRVLPRRQGLHSLRPIGVWAPGTSLSNIKTDAVPDLNSFELTVVTINCPPYVFVNGSSGFTGYMVDILNALAKLMNFRYQLYVPQDGTYGRCNNGTCSGIFGTMARGESDMALLNVSPNANRLALVDFATISVREGGLSVITKRPKKSDTNAINAYLKPFSWDVALCITVVIPLFGFLLWCGYRVVEKGAEGREDGLSDHQMVRMATDNRAIMRCLYAALQSFAQQGVDVTPTTPAARAIFGVMWLFSVFIMSSYTANLISYFTATTVDWPFESLEELFNNRYYTVGLIDGTTYLDDIQVDKKSLLNKLWERIEKGGSKALVGSLEQGLERIRKGRYALLHDTGAVESIVAKDCEFVSISERYLSGPVTLVFRKDSEFTRPFSQMLLRISESGLLVKLRRKWWPPAHDCSRDRGFEGISLWAATSILSVLACGLFLGLAALVLERCVAAVGARKESINQQRSA